MKTPNTSVDHSTAKVGWSALGAAFVFALLLALSACSGEPDEAGEAKTYPPPDPLFYELANADGEVEGWLLGTIHALPEGVLWRTPAIDEAASNADLLLVEVATLGQSDGLREIFIELSQSPGLAPVRDRVSPHLRTDLDAMIERSNLSRARWRTSEDWAAAIMLAQVDAPGQPENGVDRALIADFAGREVRGFETARGQLGIFDTLAAEDQLALLEGTIEDWAHSRDDRGKLLRAWLIGDADTLEAATTKGIMADKEVRDALLVNRNNHWMEQLVPILNEEPKPLIAVGAAHLLGPDGLAAMLQSEGYTANRIAASQSPQ